MDNAFPCTHFGHYKADNTNRLKTIQCFYNKQILFYKLKNKTKVLSSAVLLQAFLASPPPHAFALHNIYKCIKSNIASNIDNEDEEKENKFEIQPVR